MIRSIIVTTSLLFSIKQDAYCLFVLDKRDLLG